MTIFCMIGICRTRLKNGTDSGMPELIAEELRLTGRALGSMLGETTADDILGIIFSKFCIGK